MANYEFNKENLIKLCDTDVILFWNSVDPILDFYRMRDNGGGKFLRLEAEDDVDRILKANSTASAKYGLKFVESFVRHNTYEERTEFLAECLKIYPEIFKAIHARDDSKKRQASVKAGELAAM